MATVSGRVEILTPEARREHVKATLRANRLVDLAAAHLMRQKACADLRAPLDYAAAYAYAEAELAKVQA